MTRNLSYFWSLLPGLITIGGNWAGGPWAFSNVIFVLGVLCILEWFVPENTSNVHSENATIPNLILYTHVLLQILCLLSLIYSIKMGRVSGVQIVGAAISTGFHSGTSAIVVSHELIHRKNALLRFFGKLLLFSSGNIYFYIEHLRVHHKWVGTDRDPATAKRNESLYQFFIRSMFGQIKSAFLLESKRLGPSSIPNFFRNEIVQNGLLQLLFLGSIYYFFGIMMLMVFALQILIANFLLEYTNYIEHYGLSRKENERVKEDLSWQTDKIISRFLLIDLSRHSDHHFVASKPYHTLKSHAGSPVLPGGYASSIYLALIPSLWFKIVNSALDNFHAKNK